MSDLGRLIVDELVFHIVDIRLDRGDIMVVGRHEVDRHRVWNADGDTAVFGPDGELVMSCSAGGRLIFHLEPGESVRHQYRLTITNDKRGAPGPRPTIERA